MYSAGEMRLLLLGVNVGLDALIISRFWDLVVWATADGGCDCDCISQADSSASQPAA